VLDDKSNKEKDMSIEAMKLALEAHKKNERHQTVAETRYWCQQYKLMAEQFIQAIEQAEQPACEHEWLRGECLKCGQSIEQAEQAQPVVWMYQDKSTHEVRFQKHMSEFVDHSKTSEVPLYGEPLANHELQCVCGAVWCGDEMVHLPNKTPPRQPLTDQEIVDLCDGTLTTWEQVRIARAIEAAHGIKGEA
jgi:hypothetical protein